MVKENKKLIGVVGDLHLKEKLGYADLIEGGRKEEEEEVLNAIVEELEDCDEIVLLGDNFNAKNNTSEVIKRFVSFLGKFKDKKLYILAGNHEKHADGRTAIDFLKEVEEKNWEIITDGIYNYGNITFLPYMTKPELEADNDAEGTKKLMSMLKEAGGDVLFMHHAISDSMAGVVMTNLFNEPVLPKTGLEKLFKITMGGHIHMPQVLPGDKIYIAGSIFNNAVGEAQKYVWKVDKEALTVSQHKIPGRGIYKLENPTAEELNVIPSDSIVKVIINDKKLKETVPSIKISLQAFDASVVLEQYQNERKKLHFEEGMLDLGVEKLLDIYAKERKVDRKKLKVAWDLIQ